VGAGFLAEYDDGTAGQARHFAGTAAAAALVGEKPAELLAHHLVDPAESIDGHLSTAALAFARVLIEGELPLDRAGAWIEANLCDPGFESKTGFSPFDVFSEGSADAAALRSRFSDSEWRALAELPERVAVAAALSEPTGGFDDVRDLVAGMRGIEAATESTSALVRAVVAERYDEGFDWGTGDQSPAERIEQTLADVRAEMMGLRKAGIDPAEIGAYASFLLNVANRSVRGSRSGGVLGIGGRQVSSREVDFLDRLALILDRQA
jgi:hypothetical protein